MKKALRIISFILTITLVVTIFSGIDFNINANEPPISSSTYDFTKLEVGTDVVTSIDGASLLAARNPSNTNAAFDTSYMQTTVNVDNDNVYGNGADAKSLEIEFVGYNAGTGVKSSAAFVDFQYPDSTDYPVNKFSGTATLTVPQVDNASATKITGGTSFIIGKKTAKVKVSNVEKEVTQYLYTSVGLFDQKVNVYKANGTLSTSIGFDSFTVSLGGTGKFNYHDTCDTESPERSDYTSVSGISNVKLDATAFVEYVINDEGEPLSDIQKAALISYLNALSQDGKALTAYEREMDFSVEDKDDKAQITIALPNFPGYSAIVCEEEMPSVLKFTYSIEYGSYTPYIGAIGWAYNNPNTFVAKDVYHGIQSVNSVSVEYDTSTYYEAEYYAKAEEFETLANNTLNGISIYKKADIAAYQALVDAYDALDKENVLPKLDAEIVKKMADHKVAVAALNDGADVYDNFENGLNWELEGSYNANMVPTNTYDASYVVRTNTATENSNAFWGIKDGALWLRKSFNTAYQKSNTEPIAKYPTVLAVPKTDIVSADKRIQKISGKMYYYKDDIYGNGYHASIGLVYDYTWATDWSGIGLTYGYKVPFNQTSRTSEETQVADIAWKFINNSCEIIEGADHLACSSNADQGVNCFAFEQWTDFSLEYDYSRGYYVYTLTGLHRDTSKTNGCQSDDHATGEVVTIKLGIIGATELLTKVGLFNGNSVGQSFDDIAISFYDSKDFDSMVNELPEVGSITLEHEETINKLSLAYTKLTDSEREKVTTLSKLSAAIEKLNKLLLDRDSQLSPEAALDFETKETGEVYFQGENMLAQGGWRTVENPYKTQSNNSNKVLKITKNFKAENSVNTSGKAIYRIKDAILNRDRMISSFTGKVYLKNTESHSIVFDYVDEDNWQAYKISQNKNTNKIFIYREICDAGVLSIPGGGSGTNLVFETNEEMNLENGIWVEFDVEYKLLTATMSLRVFHDGKYMAGKFPITTTLLETAETQIGFATESTAYFDDIKLLFQGTNDYILAENFKAEHDYILDLVPVETYASVIDIPYCEALKTEFGTLPTAVKDYLPFMETRVEHISNVFAKLDTNSDIAKRDNEALEKVQAVTGDYSNYTITEDFENGLTYFQPAYENRYNSGAVKVEYSEQLGSNALKINGKTDITLKEILLPEKPQLAKITYKIIANIETNKSYRQRVFTNFERDDYNLALAFFYNTDKRATTFHLQGGNFYNYGKEIETKLDIKTVWNVEINYDIQGKYEVILTDGNGENYVYNNTASVMAIFALGCYNTETYIDDLTVTYRKGNYELDIVNEDITVYYSGNVMNNAGDFITLEGENLGNNVFAVSVAPVANEFSEEVGYVNQERFDRTLIAKGDYSINPTEHRFDEQIAVETRIVQKTDNSIKIQIPSEFANGEKPTSAVYAVKLVNSKGEARIIYVNNPVIDFTMGTDGDIAVANKELRIVGKNLAPIDKNSTKVKIIGNGYDIVVPVQEIQSTYSISVKLPYYLPEGKYEIYVYNGYGDNTCWSAPERITVGKDIRSTWKQDVFNVRDFGAKGDGEANDGPAIVNALNAAAKNGGGTVFLPEGSYIIESEIIIPEKVRFVGESVKATSITVRPYNFFYGKLPEAIIKISSNVEVSNISFITSRIGGLIGSRDTQAENVYIENIYFYSDPAAGAISSAANGLTGLLSINEMLTMVTLEPINSIFGFIDYGKNIQIRNNDVEDHKVVASRGFVTNNRNGSTYWQVQNNIFYNGGTEIIANSMLYEGNTSRQSPMGVWGHGVYMDNNNFVNSMSNNRELYVADRNSLYRGTSIPVSKDANNTQFIIRGSYSYKMQGETQLYVVDGQGVGQTRKVVETKPVVSGGISYLYLTIDSPFHIPINVNSTIIFRRSRENIFFVDSRFENGSAGGFYGCCADVVYDNCTFKQVEKIYQWAIKNDVNWYMTFLGCETEYQESLVHVGSNAGGGRQGMAWMADSGVNAQLAFTMRNCVFDGQYTYFKANGTNCMTDVILDNNCYMNYDYAYNIYPNKREADRTYEYINGLLIARNTYQNIDNVFYSGSETLVNAMLKTTNTAASKRLVIIDDGEANKNERKLGDVNADGKISIKDATYITYYYVGKLELTVVQQNAADVNGDGEIDLKDSTLIKRFILGYINKFPADTGSGGNTGGGGSLPEEEEEPSAPPVNEKPYEDLTDDNLYIDGYY